ncbi:energy transducer TonB [Flavihumibacter fluvii]|uniref:energy transducer TonB n=1 Tax=Flavihumibacter fluvii TaxID=2838157 RepID=UPI001BDDE2A6|nr:TonB family protein [Flavihumibacter fluvii]ULQ50795.1 energy transducer TonB [Flavihumibacter fluvii]
MKPELILRSDLLDILFEHRNKDYGAYALRRQYNDHLMAGIGGMVLLSAGLWLYTLSNHNNKGNANSLPVFTVSDTFHLSPPPDLATPPPPPPPPQAHKPRIKTVDNTQFVIDPDVAHSELPEQNDLYDARIGTTTTSGDPDIGINTGPAIIDHGPVKAAPIPPPMEEAPEILLTASVMPQFPGGDAALQKWLSRQLRPQEEQQPGQRIKVVVRFVVDKTGDIDRVELVQQGGEPYDNEVLRVIHKMPRWTAGQHMGKTVAVWFSIPIIFEMPEQ